MEIVTTHSFVITGEPVSYPENQSKNYRSWNDHRRFTAKYEVDLGNQFEGQALMNGPLLMEIDFYFSSKTGQRKIHSTKPDLYNLVRFIEKACSGIIYENDCLLTQIVASKKYDQQPRTQFKISRIRA